MTGTSLISCLMCVHAAFNPRFKRSHSGIERIEPELHACPVEIVDLLELCLISRVHGVPCYQQTLSIARSGSTRSAHRAATVTPGFTLTGSA
jgi:hypothetical protein